MIRRYGLYLVKSAYVDTEWNSAAMADEAVEYYKCKMLNGGTCIKAYKPALAAIVLKRGAFSKMSRIV